MQLTNWQRTKKLAYNLASHPRLAAGYFRFGLLGKRLPVDYDLPWWSFLAIEEADRILAGRTLFEFGTGGSTTRYAKSAKRVVAVEDDEQWARVVSSRLQKQDIHNVDLIVAPFDFRNPGGFCESDYLAAFMTRRELGFDAIIIDGQDWTFRERISCFRTVEPHIARGGVIIVDDFWRYPELLETNRASKIKVFESVGPCRVGVTSTAFFYY